MDRRYEISELLSQIALKPKLLTIFVEGIYDEKILKYYLRKTGNGKSVSVKRIETVNVPDEVLVKYNLSPSHRNRVIAISKEIALKFSGLKSILCVIDRDLDDYLGVNYSADNLYYTDFTSLETYHFTKDSFEVLLLLSRNSPSVEAEQLIATLLPILKKLFAIRIVNEKFEYKLSKIELTGRFKVRKKELEFNSSAYLLEYLRANSIEREFAKINEQATEIENQLFGDPRLYVHGRDMIHLLYEYFSNTVNKKGEISVYKIEDDLMKLFAQHEEIKSYPLFERVSAFAN